MNQECCLTFILEYREKHNWRTTERFYVKMVKYVILTNNVTLVSLTLGIPGQIHSHHVEFVTFSIKNLKIV